MAQAVKKINSKTGKVGKKASKKGISDVEKPKKYISEHEEKLFIGSPLFIVSEHASKYIGFYKAGIVQFIHYWCLFKPISFEENSWTDLDLDFLCQLTGKKNRFIRIQISGLRSDGILKTVYYGEKRHRRLVYRVDYSVLKTMIPDEFI